MTGIDQQLTDTATDFSWFTLAFYVPILWVTAIMLFWQLYTRRNEPLESTPTAQASSPGGTAPGSAPPKCIRRKRLGF